MKYTAATAALICVATSVSAAPAPRPAPFLLPPGGFNNMDDFHKQVFGLKADSGKDLKSKLNLKPYNYEDALKWDGEGYEPYDWTSMRPFGTRPMPPFRPWRLNPKTDEDRKKKEECRKKEEEERKKKEDEDKKKKDDDDKKKKEDEDKKKKEDEDKKKEDEDKKKKEDEDKKKKEDEDKKKKEDDDKKKKEEEEKKKKEEEEKKKNGDNKDKWTIKNFERKCKDGSKDCEVRFEIDTHASGKTPTKCDFRMKDDREQIVGVKCGDYTISSGWSGQFGEGNGFTTLSVVEDKSRRIAWPAYTDKQLKDGKVVSPDQSYPSQEIPK